LPNRPPQGAHSKSRVKSRRKSTPEGYSLTAATAFDAACRVVAGEIKPGSQTPSRAFGVDYILNFDGVVREDLNRRAARPNPPAICSLTFGHSSS
jgi:hypothetical protein